MSKLACDVLSMVSFLARIEAHGRRFGAYFGADNLTSPEGLPGIPYLYYEKRASRIASGSNLKQVSLAITVIYSHVRMEMDVLVGSRLSIRPVKYRGDA
jgi:hypothetical protein